MNKGTLYCLLLTMVIALLFILNLVMGSVDIPVGDTLRILLGEESQRPSWQYIILQSRLPTGIDGNPLRCLPSSQWTDAADRLP